MKKDLSLEDFEQDRFNYVPLQGGFGDKDHNNYIKMKKNGVVKHFAVTQEKTVEQMIDEFNVEQQEEKKKDGKNKFIAVANTKNSKKPLNKNLSGSQLFADGLNDIQLELAYDQNGNWVYPQVPKYQESGQYFAVINPKTEQEVKIISIKLTYQAFGKPDKSVIVNMSMNQTIQELKLKAKQAFNISNVQHILLDDAFMGVFQKDKKTLAQQNLQNNSQIYVRVIEIKACFPGNSKIKIINSQNQVEQKQLNEVKIGDRVLSYNQKGTFQYDTITFIQKLKTKVLMKIQLENGKSVRSTTEDKYLTCEGWKKYGNIGNIYGDPEVQRQRLTQNDLLGVCQENKQNLQRSRIVYQKIKLIEVLAQKNVIQVYHLSIQKNHTYIINDFIVHNMQIEIWNPQNDKTIKLAASPLDLVQAIKKKVAAQFKLQQKDFVLLFVHKELQNKKSLNDYKIGKGDKIMINLLKKVQNKLIKQPQVKGKVQEKWLIIKDNEQLIRLKYESNKNKQVSKVIQEIKKYCPPYFSLLHGSMFLQPTCKISQVEKNPQFSKLNQINCVIVQSAQKKLFYDHMFTNNYKQIIDSYKNQEKKSQLIKKFRTQESNKIIMDQIFRFDSSDTDTTDQIFIKDLRQVVLGFLALQKYQNQTENINIKLQDNTVAQRNVLKYNLYKTQKYYGFNKKNQKGEAFYFKEFLQTKKKYYKEVITQKHNKQTIFFVRSLTGRNLGKISEKQFQQEIVFLPFTYFTVDEIIVDNPQNITCQYVFLTEMQTLFNYKNPFLLWVDDLPENKSNTQIYQQISKENPDLEIIRLVSTTQAEGWMREFAWVLNWQNIKFKIISDMTREQISSVAVTGTLDKIVNGQYYKIEERNSAGIDLIEVCSERLGFTTLITIFCGNKVNAENKVKERNFKRGLNYHQIIISNKELITNINAFLQQNK